MPFVKTNKFNRKKRSWSQSRGSSPASLVVIIPDILYEDSDTVEIQGYDQSYQLNGDGI